VLFLGLLALFAARTASAGSPEVQVSGGDSLSLWVLVDWDHPLPSFVEDRLRRGIPATVAVRAELWKSRSTWVDQQLASEVRELQIVRDPWGGGFSVVEDSTVAPADSMATLQQSLARHRLRVAIDPSWCDGTSEYRVAVTTFVRPLTAQDMGELDQWLRGELGGFRGGLLGLPRGLFGIVRDLSGLGERRSRAESAAFRLFRVQGNRVRVLVPGVRDSETVPKVNASRAAAGGSPAGAVS
jgi:hypothetical protein